MEGKYYLILASFDLTGSYYLATGMSPYPVPASFGSLIAGAGWNWVPDRSFPPPSTQTVPDHAFGGAVAYYQTLVTDRATTWLAVDPENGVVPSGQALDVAVIFDAAGLDGGDYLADVVVTTNDPDETEVRVPAHLHVTGAADVTVEPTALDFGSFFVGLTRADTVEVRNDGTDVLHVTEVGAGPGEFTADPSGFTLLPREKRLVEVRFQPLAFSLQPLVEPLSQREFEILRLIADGLTHQEIADRLVLSLPTVKWHTGNLYGKLGVNSRTQAAARARELGILTP